jgi:hypothetical protein
MADFADKFRIEDCKAVGSTEMGIWVSCPDWDKEEFVPQSKIDDDSNLWKEGDEGALVVDGWLADQRKWR